MSDMKSAAHLSWDELQEIGLSAASKAIDRAAAVTAPSPDVLLAEAAAFAVPVAMSLAAAAAVAVPAAASLAAAAAELGTIGSAADQAAPAVARHVPSLAKLLEAREQLDRLLRYMDGKGSADPDRQAPARSPRRSPTVEDPTKTQ